VEGFLTFLPGKTLNKNRRNKMSKLKHDSVTKCISLLREYIDETSLTGKKEIAVLALSQLQQITAGTDSQVDTLRCHGRPMVNVNPTG
jgi:hypothetical protein